MAQCDIPELLLSISDSFSVPQHDVGFSCQRIPSRTRPGSIRFAFDAKILRKTAPAYLLIPAARHEPQS